MLISGIAALLVGVIGVVEPDAVLFFLIGVLIVGIITIQIAILFGVPKLIEWLKH